MSPMNILEFPFDSLANLANKARWKLINSRGIRVLKTLFPVTPKSPLLRCHSNFPFHALALETSSANGLI